MPFPGVTDTRKDTPFTERHPLPKDRVPPWVLRIVSNMPPSNGGGGGADVLISFEHLSTGQLLEVTLTQSLPPGAPSLMRKADSA